MQNATIQDVARGVAVPYRAKDITMAATLDPKTRTVYLTGAIDAPRHDILVRVQLPAPGVWHVIKAETNLTQESWTAWQITLSDGTKLLEGSKFSNISQQFKRLFVSEDARRFCFFGGEVRPGEPILKQFTLETQVPRIAMAHNRQGGCELSINPLEEVPMNVKRGFPRQPVIESWIVPYVR